jgi:hypothetical protein
MSKYICIRKAQTSYTPSILKYKIFYPIIDIYVSRHILMCRLESKGANIYTKKHLNTYVSMIGSVVKDESNLR